MGLVSLIVEIASYHIAKQGCLPMRGAFIVYDGDHGILLSLCGIVSIMREIFIGRYRDYGSFHCYRNYPLYTWIFIAYYGDHWIISSPCGIISSCMRSLSLTAEIVGSSHYHVGLYPSCVRHLFFLSWRSENSSYCMWDSLLCV